MDDNDPVGYGSAEEAANAALLAALPLSENFEYGGIIYEHEGKFYFSQPQTSKGTHDVKIRASKPKGSKLIALYHTHPNHSSGKAESHLFSDGDIDISTRMGIPYYMGVYGTDVRSVFVPGTSQVQIQRQRSKRARTSLGEPFVFPPEPPPDLAPQAIVPRNPLAIQ